MTHYNNVQNAIDCQKLCQNWPGCQYWTWISSDPGANVCYMKDNITTINDEGDQGQDVLSGPKYCGIRLYKITLY